MTKLEYRRLRLLDYYHITIQGSDEILDKFIAQAQGFEMMSNQESYLLNMK